MSIFGFDWLFGSSGPSKEETEEEQKRTDTYEYSTIGEIVVFGGSAMMLIIAGLRVYL